MRGYNFTERVRKVLMQSRIEAERMRHEYVGTEHLLLGLLDEQEGVASVVLDRLSANRDAMRALLMEAVKHGSTRETLPRDLPYTSRAKKVLELSMQSARELSHSYVGTEHLLLGLLLEEKGIGANILVQGGITLDAARHEVLGVLGGPGAVSDDARESPAARRTPAPPASEELIRRFHLMPHPEGGFYREVFRSSHRVREGERDRSAVTTIYYMLPEGACSRWHVVQSDEVWHAYQADRVELLDYDPQSNVLTRVLLGRRVENPEYVHVIPAGHWQAVAHVERTSLLGCTVAPGFEFADFRLVNDVPGHEAAFAGVLAAWKDLL